MHTSELDQPEKNFDEQDRIIVNLKRGLVARVGRVDQSSKFVYSGKSERRSEKWITFDVINYRPKQLGELEIDGRTLDGYEITISLSQCRNLTVLGYSSDFQMQAA